MRIFVVRVIGGLESEDGFSMRAVDRTKAFIKAAFPESMVVYRRIREVQERYYLRSPFLRSRFLGSPSIGSPSTDVVFSYIYRNNLWGDPESVSGRGSTLARTETIRSALPGVLKSVKAKSLLDAPCGDFNWMRHVDLGGVEYTGADVVPELIKRNQQAYSAQGSERDSAQDSERAGGRSRTFVVADVTRDPLPRVDVILCRDCFIHLSFRDINAALANFKRSDSSFLLATTHVTVTENKDTHTGSWRNINLQLSPFSLPQPRQLIVEDAELGKCLGLWNLNDLEPHT